MKQYREAWSRHTEARDWEWWLGKVEGMSNAQLQQDIAECKTETDAIRKKAPAPGAAELSAMAKNKQTVEAAERPLLREIQELTGRQFVYEARNGGFVPTGAALSEAQTGPPAPFAELHPRDQIDVLDQFIRWEQYPEPAWDDDYKIRENIAAGKPPEAWLEGTSLRQSFQHLAEGKTPPPVQREPEIRQEDVINLLDQAKHEHHAAGELSAALFGDGADMPKDNPEIQKDGPEHERDGRRR